MKAKVGSARIGETGSARNNTAGDQTGKEVSIQDWYLHSKGWRVFRCVDEYRAKKIADAMKMACDNDFIGYDQSNRLSLYDTVKNNDFDPSTVSAPVECDCSSLVRVCLAYAGIKTANFTTASEGDMIMGTGLFSELLSDKYTKSESELKAGDILVTRTQGHTVIVVSDGSASYVCPYKEPVLTVKKGSKGEGAKWVQWQLNKHGEKLDVDGSFGPLSVAALGRFQAAHKLDIDFRCGRLTRAELKKE